MLIHEAVVGDREHPPPQILIAAPKTAQAPSNANKHLAEYIFALGGTSSSKVTMHRCSKRGEDIINPPLDRSLVRPGFHPHWYSGCCHVVVVVVVLVVDSVVVEVVLSFVTLVVAVGSSWTVVVVGCAATVVVVAAATGVVV